MSPGTTSRARVSRRRAIVLRALLLAAALAAGWALLHTADDAPGPPAVLRFHSEPHLDPDALTVTVPAHDTAPGLVFLAVKRGPGQDGPMIVDDHGHVVWFQPVPAGMAASLFNVQRYHGQPVLTWWQGHTRFGHGMGEYVVLDRHYRQIARIRAADGQQGDHHELQLTPRGTALMTAYAERPMDLTAVGGPRDGSIFESIIQEVDIRTGRLVWEWHSADHVPVTEGKTSPKQTKPHDYFHVNSIELDRDGNLIVSARNTFTIYKIAYPSGKILWRLGGRRNDFQIGPGAHFAFQHDARLHPAGTLTLFDNEATPPHAEQSRGLILRLDEHARTARLVRAYTHPDKLLAGAEGSVQTLPGGNVLIGWGPGGHVSEHAPDGRIRFDLQLPDGADTYQAFRHPWHGRPLQPPALAARRTAQDHVTAWVSWNGATNLARWRILAGNAPHALTPIATAPHANFETTIRVRTTARYLAAQALDRAGRALATSKPIQPSRP